MTRVVLDTNIVLDYLSATRPRHLDAVNLLECLLSSEDTAAVIPAGSVEDTPRRRPARYTGRTPTPREGGTMPRTPIAKMSLAKVYPLLVQKAERKGRTREEVDEVTCWLTGYDVAGLERQIAAGVDYETFFSEAPALNPNRALITGKVCGVDVAAIADPVEQNARYLDKLVDELARGRSMEKILRS